ncbi:hypothetical protein JTB14_019902, partial [Gonioctena quinquepunctata]
NEDCDKLGIILYEDLGCKPVIKDGHECPIKYDCDLEAKNDTCMFRGRSLIVGEGLDNSLTYDTCNVGCSCRDSGKFTCAILDCPEWLGAVPVRPGCYRKYAVDKCCSIGQNCRSFPIASDDDEKFGKCEVDGQTHQEGDRFYPTNSCLKCVCPKDFNGKLEEPHCKRQSCAAQIRNSDKISKNCAPFYRNNDDVPLCCPDEWVCPQSSDVITIVNTEAKPNSDLTCKFGEKIVQLGEGLVSKVDFYGKTKDVKCECILPHFLTCREVLVAAD